MKRTKELCRISYNEIRRAKKKHTLNFYSDILHTAFFSDLKGVASTIDIEKKNIIFFIPVSIEIDGEYKRFNTKTIFRYTASLCSLEETGIDNVYFITSALLSPDGRVFKTVPLETIIEGNHLLYD